MSKTADSVGLHRDIREIGCIVCLRMSGMFRECDIHHVLSGGRRVDEMHVIGLCPGHHRGGSGDGTFISRHPWKSRFENQYGTEEELLQQTRVLVSQLRKRRV